MAVSYIYHHLYHADLLRSLDDNVLYSSAALVGYIRMASLIEYHCIVHPSYNLSPYRSHARTIMIYFIFSAKMVHPSNSEGYPWYFEQHEVEEFLVED